MALVTVSGVSKKNGDGFSVKHASFTQESFQHIAMAGETGSGKTTLLKMIAGLVQPDEGLIQFEGKKIIGPNDQLIPGHPGIAYLSQYFELRNNYWVHEWLEMANKLEVSDAENIFRICQVDHLADRRTDQLSGGEKQRIALARLLITSPKLLLLDEPFSNLDIIHKNTIKQVIQDISEQMSITCILVSHDPADILSWADIILLMKDGEIVQQGTPEEVYRKPVNEYCAGLLGEYNIIPGDILKADIPAGKQWMVRPENFIMGQEGDHVIMGVLHNLSFYGSYYAAELITGHHTIKARITGNYLQPGDKVYLSVASENIWFI
ncbi:MAG: ABC transporter ATP-binding protein [Chitinophagaceae bacterium]|nr:ABC transporter ATP-binding protein [Chitinophagaceae bacterium]